MTEAILDLMTGYGVAILFFVTFLSCLCIPIPSSLMMLAAGSFAATGDLNPASTAAAAYTGAVAGDNTGYFIARKFGTQIAGWLETNPKRAMLRDRAKSYMDSKGAISVFLSCWLAAPLGPYVNLVCGLTRFNWAKFAFWGAMGEVFWVGIYISLGYSFSDQITTLASVLGNASGFIVALLGIFLIGRWLWAVSAPNRNTT